MNKMLKIIIRCSPTHTGGTPAAANRGGGCPIFKQPSNRQTHLWQYSRKNL